MKNKESINLPQFFFIIIQTQIGVGVLSLPYTMYKASKTDGWISLMIAGVFVQLILTMYYFLLKKFNGSNIFDIAQVTAGKIIGKFLICLYLFYFLLVGIMILSLFNKIIATWILPRTPSWAIGGMFSFLAAALCREGIRVIGRFYTLVTPLLLLLVFLITYTLKDANIYFLFPIGKEGIKDILLGSKEAVIAMLGFEMILVIYSLANGEHKRKYLIITCANALITLLYTYLIIINFIYYSPEEIAVVPEPMLFILKSYSFKIIERTDLFFLSIWIISVFTSFVSYLYMSAKSAKKLIPKGKNRFYVNLFAAVIFLVASGIKPITGITDKLSQLMSYISLLFIIMIPFLLLVFSYVFKRKQKGGSSRFDYH